MASCARRYYGASKEVKFDDVVAFTDRETRIVILRKDLGELENGYGHPVWQGNTAQKFRR